MKKVYLILLSMITIFIGCQSEINFQDPPEIIYGVDICDQCHMIISEASYASAYYTKDRNVRKFDDIGDMVLYHQINKELVEVFWIQSFDNEKWINANKAFFLDGFFITPMAHGIIAFSNEEKANSKASEVNLKVKSFEEILSIDIEKRQEELNTKNHKQH